MLSDFKQFSFRGYAAELDGEVLAIAGVIHTVPLQAFSLMHEGMRKYPKTIIKAIKVFRELLNKYDQPVFAIADEKESNSEKLLMKTGFEPMGGRVFKWHG